jgi:FKBP-type peptidyl-prolyl isomerase-like protein
MRPGVEILDETPGPGAPVERHVFYDFRLRIWLSRGEPVRWTEPWGLCDRARLEDDGATLFTSLRVDRVFLFAGLFYGVEGMRVGGTRRLRVAPHLAYGERGVPGVIPPQALLTVEVEVLREREGMELPP